MAKSDLDRLRIISKIYNGEDVVEHFKSERTAKAEVNRIVKLLKDWRFPMSASADSLGTTEEEFNTLMEDYRMLRRETNGCEKPEIFVMDPKKVLSWEEHNHNNPDNKTDTTLRVELHFHHIKPNKFGSLFSDAYSSGTYRAEFDNNTKTSKQNDYEEVNRLLKLRDEKRGLFWEPGSTVYFDSRTTDSTFKAYIDRLKETLASDEVLPPCSEKQAYWVAKKMGCSQSTASTLNKLQASQLLAVLFDKEGHYESNPITRDEILKHYREILNITNEAIVRDIIRDVLKRYII